MRRIVHPVTLAKSELLPISQLRGCVNLNALQLGDQSYDAESLVFLGFEGRSFAKAPRMYVGQYTFRPADNTDEELRRVPLELELLHLQESEVGDE